MTCDLTRDSGGGGAPQEGGIPEEDVAGNFCGLLGPVACFVGREQPLRVNGRGDSRAENTRRSPRQSSLVRALRHQGHCWTFAGP